MARARRAREIERTRQDILEAAARAFVQGGFKAATMQDIAKEAGYTAASLYSYFSSKEEILTGLRELVMEELAETFDSPFPDGLSLRQKLDLLLRRQVDFAQRRKELFAILHLGSQMGEGRCSEEPLGLFERRVGLLVDFLEANATPEELGGRTAREVSLVMAGLSFVFFYEWMRPGGDVGMDPIPRLLDLLFHGIHSGPPPAGGRK